MEQNRAVIFDTEATGTEEDAQVIQWAAAEVEIVNGDLAFLDWQGRDCSHTVPMTFGALATHHILPEDLAHCDPFDPTEVPEAPYFVGHNVDFDMKFLNRPNVKHICTLALSRKYFPKCDSHSQTALMYYTVPHEDWRELQELLQSAHDASADIGFCAHILDQIIKITGAKTFEELYLLSEEARVPEFMTFGKHKGKHMSEVDAGYRGWYMKQPDTDPYVLEAFRRYPCRR